MPGAAGTVALEPIERRGERVIIGSDGALTIGRDDGGSRSSLRFMPGARGVSIHPAGGGRVFRATGGDIKAVASKAGAAPLFLLT